MSAVLSARGLVPWAFHSIQEFWSAGCRRDPSEWLRKTISAVGGSRQPHRRAAPVKEPILRESVIEHDIAQPRCGHVRSGRSIGNEVPTM